MRVLAIGAGVGGLAAAIRLAAQGHAVTLLEANPFVGGKLSEFRLGDYRFDAGPSLFTQPEYVAELFALAGERMADHLPYLTLSEVCRYHWPDDSRLIAPTGREAMAQALHEAFGEDPATVRAYLNRAAEKFALAGNIFLNRPLHKLSTYTDRAVAKAVLGLPKLQMLRSLHSLNAATFKDARTVQLFDRYATYNGSDPFQASALYSMIPSLEYGQGAYLPQGGMVQIALALEGLAKRLGVDIRLSTPVRKLLVKGRQAIGVETAHGETLLADAIFSNTDISHLYHELAPATMPKPRRALAQPPSTSAIVFYWGVKAAPPALGLHNIFFSSDYEAEFQDLFRHNRIPAEPTIYLNISAVHEPADAPPGCQNWFVMVNVPADPTLATPQALATLRTQLAARLSQATGTDLPTLIEQEHILTPALLQQRTSAWQGALYGSNSNSLLSGFWRHPNQSPHIPNLYFTGGTVHPGGGIPLALKSAQIAVGLATGQ